MGAESVGAPGRANTVDYVCLQPMQEGQASYAHVAHIVAGLRERDWSVRLIRPPLPRRDGFDGLRRAVNLALTQARYWASIRFRPAEVVYIRTHFAALPTALIAKARRVSVVQELNGPIEDAYDAWPALRRARRLIAWSIRTQLRTADVIVAVTPGLASYATELTEGKTRCHVVGNGADATMFHPERRSEAPADRPYVVFVGALASWQGIDVMMDATASVAWPSGVDLVIAGDGRERERVVLASETRTGIRWLGTVPYRQSADLVAGSLAALIPKIGGPSTKYGLSPLKLFEAMASGVPVVVSDLPGLSDVVEAHACGLVVQSGNPEALALAVRQLASDTVLAAAMGSRGRAAVESEYSWSIRAGQVEKVLLDLAARRAHGASRPSG